MGRIALLETSDIGARYTAEAILALGHTPLFLCDLSKYQADPLRQINAFSHIDCDTRDPDVVCEVLRNQGPMDFVGIMSLADERLKTAAEVARSLGVPGLDPAVIALKDKGTVSRLTPEFSPPGIVFDPDPVPTDEIQALLQKYSKLLIKPTRGAGSLGVFYVRTESDVEGIAATIASKYVPAHMTEGGWIAQSFVSGELASVEGFVLGGQITILGFTDRRKVGFTESCAAFPSDGTFSPNQRKRAQLASQALVERSGFQHGYFHIEFIFDVENDTCYLIDANMGRLGGGPIGELLALSYGIDPVRIYRHVLEVSLFGGSPELPYAQDVILQESLAVLYGLEEGGQLQGVEFPSDIHCYHTQLLASGTHVSPMGKDDWSWIGIVTGRTPETRLAMQKLRIFTSNGDFPPCY